MIYVANKRRKLERIQKEFPNAKIFDITSSASTPQGRKLSPLYPHGNIPIPGNSGGKTATCVESIWQGLKVFENAGIDTETFSNDTMQNIKRTVQRFGKPLGHQFGVFSKEILNYADARRYIYIPTYRYVLDNIPSVHSLVMKLAERAKKEDFVLLDYNFNPNNRDLSKPLSHAELVKMYIEGRYPEKDEDFIPYTAEELKAMKSLRKTKTEKREIKTPEDKKNLTMQITKLLEHNEMTAKEIGEELAVKGGSRVINPLLQEIPKLKVRTEGRQKFYTLMDSDE